MAKVLTAKTIKQLVEKYNLNEIYVVIEHGVYGGSSGADKDKLAASLRYRNTNVNLRRNPQIHDELFEPLIDTLANAVKNYSHDLEVVRFTSASGRVHYIGFMAQGWPKLSQLLKALGIKFEISLTLIRDKERDLTPEGAKILGI